MVKKEGVEKEGNLEFIELFLQHLRKEHKYSETQIREALQSKKTEYFIPANLFSTPKLSCFEVIVKYLKENQSLSFKRIAELTNRDYTSVYTTYAKSRNKFKEVISVSPGDILIPLSILKERKLSVLESIVAYLKERYDLTLHAIAELLGRDDRTIWTVHNRVKKKGGAANGKS